MKNTAGILLIEALISVVILGSAITLCVRSFINVSKVHELSKNYLTAAQLLNEKMSELEALPSLEEGEIDETFEAPYERYAWHAEIEKVIDDALEENEESTLEFFKVSGQVSWIAHTGRSLQIDTLFAKKKAKEDESESAETE
jgi:Tfp pilus assembly protein PilV